MRIVCIGGGPAGLYTASLLKRRDRNRDVIVVERGQRDRTFGFGVVFSDPTLDQLAARDEVTHRRLLDESVRWESIEIRMGGQVVRPEGQGFSAIARARLLSMLQGAAVDVGVDLRFETEVVPDSDLLASADLVVVADGSHSPLRAHYQHEFRPVIRTGRAKYIWFGTTKIFDSLTFAFEQNEHGAFAVHAYPYDASRSTFLVETDETSWRNAGLDAAPASGNADEDPRSLEYCRALFARHLDGHPLLSNRSRWTNFQTVTNDHWSFGNRVLVGDAAHTAHFSIGSGTKMAMEDALALATALDETTDVIEACKRYERARRPEVTRLQTSAIPSLAWWEGFHRYLHLAPPQFAFHFLTRNLKLSRGSLKRRDPAFLRYVEESRAVEALAGREPYEAPLALRSVTLAGRIARWSESGTTAGAGLILHRVAVARPTDLEPVRQEVASTRAALALGPGANDPAIGLVVRARELDEATCSAIAALADVIDLVLWNADDRVPDKDAFDALRAAWPAERPLGVHLPRWSVTEAATRRLGTLIECGCDLVCVDFDPRVGNRNRDTLLAADQLRNDLHVPTMVSQGGSSLDDVSTIVVAGRADLCLVEENRPLSIRPSMLPPSAPR